MINITMNTKGAVDHQTISGINNAYTHGAVSAQNIESLNTRHPSGHPGAGVPRTNSPVCAPRTASPSAPFPDRTPVQAQPAANPPRQTPPVPNVPSQTQTPGTVMQSLPSLLHPVQKGQKTALSASADGPLTAVHARFGWNTTDPRCDVDVSAFLLGEDGKVPGDSWFVFYGQTESPDGSAAFRTDGGTDREVISIDFGKLDPCVKKIVFVLTINDAFTHNLNFSMMKDAYIRIMDADGRTELTSFQMTEYYSNVISMMIGELYLHNGAWKFNAVGNGVARDLAGLCALYGVDATN